MVVVKCLKCSPLLPCSCYGLLQDYGYIYHSQRARRSEQYTDAALRLLQDYGYIYHSQRAWRSEQYTDAALRCV